MQWREELEGRRVKIHYVGYSNNYDEWRYANEVVDLSAGGESRSRSGDKSTNDSSSMESNNDSETDSGYGTVFKPFSLYKELANKIKNMLVSSRKRYPHC